MSDGKEKSEQSLSISDKGDFNEEVLEQEKVKEAYRSGGGENLNQSEITRAGSMMNPEKSGLKKAKKKCFVNHLLETYDKFFLASLGLQYMNNGMKVMASLAYMDLFKTRYGLEPSQTQFLASIVMIPWTPKVVYGIITDTFPIFGSRKRSYIILMGLIQFLAAIMIATVSFESVYPVCFFLTMISLSGALMDVVVDGLMVI